LNNKPNARPGRTWTVAQAKARLSETLRLAAEEGPQRIGARRRFGVVPASAWDEKARSREPLGRWLVGNLPRGFELEVPDRSSSRVIPFGDEGDT